VLIYEAYLVNVIYQAGVHEGPHVFFVISQLQITQIMVFGFLKLYFSNLQRSEPENNENNNIPHL
jgi:hypothetical protein